MLCDMRGIGARAAMWLTHLATADLAAKAWPEASEMPGEAVWCL